MKKELAITEAIAAAERQRLKNWADLNDSINLYNQQLANGEKNRKLELDITERIKKAQAEILELQLKKN